MLVYLSVSNNFRNEKVQCWEEEKNLLPEETDKMEEEIFERTMIEKELMMKALKWSVVDLRKRVSGVLMHERLLTGIGKELPSCSFQTTT